METRETVSRAGNVLGSTARTIAQIAIWLFVAVLPWLAPLAAIVWSILFLVQRTRKGPGRPRSRAEEPAEPSD